MQAFAGPKIAPDAVANAPKFTMLGTKIQKLVATYGDQNSSGSVHPTFMYCAIK